MIEKKPENVSNHLEHVPAGKLLNAAERGFRIRHLTDVASAPDVVGLTEEKGVPWVTKALLVSAQPRVAGRRFS
ncbi:MAG: hypothetical protein JO166_03460 [Deltaproteobacteria bacterium]|nr:hypothetical protein [Deltaproteobacteria bacterium]